MTTTINMKVERITRYGLPAVRIDRNVTRRGTCPDGVRESGANDGNKDRRRM